MIDETSFGVLITSGSATSAQVTKLLDLEIVHSVGGVSGVVGEVPEVSLDSDLISLEANSWGIELGPSCELSAVVTLEDDVGAKVLRKVGVVGLGVSGFIR